MKWLSAAITFVNVTTVCGCLEGIAVHGLSKQVAASSVLAGLVAALLAFWGTSDARPRGKSAPSTETAPETAPRRRYRSIWLWAVVAVFAMFAFRSFCNVYFIDGNEYKIQNPNNLGDLSLHITYIKNFASGVAMWPENPIYVSSRLRYPAGIDLFNAILLCLDISVIRGLVWVGLGASAALCYALYRWGGAFTIAGFLFNGGVVGLQWFKNYEWKDYQSSNYIAWKSLALTMLVTQRGLLYALPAGLLLLIHWRAKFFHGTLNVLPQAPAATPTPTPSSTPTPPSSTSSDPAELEAANDAASTELHEPTEPAVVAEAAAAEATITEEPEAGTSDESVASITADVSEEPTAAEESSIPVAPVPVIPDPPAARGIVPFWVELSVYATMPLFHVHTFMALSFVLLFLFLFLGKHARKQLFWLGLLAFVPATFFLWLITDHFHAGSVMSWNPGWVMNNGDFARPLAAFAAQPGQAPPAAAATTFFSAVTHFAQFWGINFGITLPLIIALVVLLVVRGWKQRKDPAPVNVRLTSLLAALAVMVILVACMFAYLSLGYPLYVVLSLVPVISVAVMVPLFASLLQRSWRQTVPLTTALAFTIPAVALFLFSCLIKTAPWEWDNIKLIIWCYLIILPFLWSEMISHWNFPVRAVVCIAMFASGFFTLFGGLAAGRTGYGMSDRAEIDAVAMAVKNLPIEARFAGYPIYNHPILMQGRKMVLGYPGHIWTQGFTYGEESNKLSALMNGAPDWKETARNFNVRYIFWGREEIKNYSGSKKPWEQECKQVATGPWGSIYDILTPKETAAAPTTAPALNPAANPAPTPTPAASAK